MLQQQINAIVRNVPNFPIQGILFKDITPIFLHPQICTEIVEFLAQQATQYEKIDAVAGVESRGFLFGILLAQKLNVPFHLIRKKGKLPGETVQYTYNLEYGSATIEMHKGFVKKGQRVLIHDDVLATGGTAAASASLIEMEGGIVSGFSFLIELNALHGRKILSKNFSNIHSLVQYN